MFKAVLPLSLVISIRFLGLFIVMPTLSVYALGLKGATPILAGTAISIYAISQMLLQTPFGILSDKIGRKQTIAIGVVIFITGSIIAGFADSIYTLILGRILQGAGAIGAVVTAMISDLIHEERRTKAMAMMGISISLSFSFAMIFGPIIAGNSGTDALFFISAFLALVSLAVLYLFTPTIPKITYGYVEEKGVFSSSIANKDLRIMFFTGFFQKLLLSFAFAIIPYIAIEHFDFTKERLYTIYLPATLIGIFAMGAGAMFAERRGKYKEVLVAGAILLGLAFLGFGFLKYKALFFMSVMLFFAGFSMHEPIMQSLASKYPKNAQKGAVLGIFNSFSYLGTFLGGIIGGVAIWAGLSFAIFLLSFAVVLWWIYAISKLTLPKKLKPFYIEAKFIEGVDVAKIEGVSEYYINDAEKIAVILFDSEIIGEEELEKAIKGR